MATTKPRLTITLEPKVYAALTAFSEGTGTPKSEFISQVLEQSLPVLERMAMVIQQAKRAKPEALAKIKENTQKMAAVAELASHQVEQGADLFWNQAMPADGVRREHSERRTPSAGPEGTGRADPPSSNRGVGNQNRGGGTHPEPSKVTSLRSRRRAKT